MRLDPIPEERRWRAYLFKDLRKGLEAGRRMMTRRIHPCVIRLYDENSTRRVVKNVLNLTVEGSYMVVGCDGEKRSVDLEMSTIQEICEGLDAQDLGSEAGNTGGNTATISISTLHPDSAQNVRNHRDDHDF
jgi:alkyldihydroxyacetonephosphate synthase